MHLRDLPPCDKGSPTQILTRSLRARRRLVQRHRHPGEVGQVRGFAIAATATSSACREAGSSLIQPRATSSSRMSARGRASRPSRRRASTASRFDGKRRELSPAVAASSLSQTSSFVRSTAMRCSSRRRSRSSARSSSRIRAVGTAARKRSNSVSKSTTSLGRSKLLSVTRRVYEPARTTSSAADLIVMRTAAEVTTLQSRRVVHDPNADKGEDGYSLVGDPRFCAEASHP